MLARPFRLHRWKDFQTFHRVKPYYRSQNFSIKVQSNTLNYPRFGIIVGTKVSKKAVHRNRIKRKIRACLQKFSPPTPYGKDILIIVQRDIYDIRFAALDTTLQKIFKTLLPSRKSS